ncbi:hypothetical protein [Streptomyces albus]|uniref:hypothetical protein n=1 Tax=Streptomyces albus TaxID=1888 RepID=UPI0033F108B3
MKETTKHFPRIQGIRTLHACFIDAKAFSPAGTRRATALLIAGSATSAPGVPPKHCPEGYAYFLTGTDFTGTMSVYQKSATSGDCAQVPGRLEKVARPDRNSSATMSCALS